MTRNKWRFLFIVPTILLLGLILWRGKNRPHTLPQGAIRVPGNALKRSAAIWKDREFLNITNNRDKIHQAIESFIAPLPISTSAKSNAVMSSFGLIMAYGTGSWNDFLRTRIPVSGYETTNIALVRYGFNVQDKMGTNVDDVYHAYWQKMFQESPLFSDVSFISNSVGLYDLPWDKIKQIPTPQFTDPTNQNWVDTSLLKVYDYPPLPNSNTAKVLSLFFFTKNNEIPGFLKIAFVWDESHEVWIPWVFTVGIVQKPMHDLHLF